MSPCECLALKDSDWC